MTATPGRRLHRYQDPDVKVPMDLTALEPPHYFLCPNPDCAGGQLEVAQARWPSEWSSVVKYQCDTCRRVYLWRQALHPADERGQMGKRKRRGAR
jgi:hypothetical protein